jgi:hypothetical protein
LLSPLALTILCYANPSEHEEHPQDVWILYVHAISVRWISLFSPSLEAALDFWDLEAFKIDPRFGQVDLNTHKVGFKISVS